MNIAELVLNAYYTYTPAEGHCREGMFRVIEAGDGTLFANDTYWGSGFSQSLSTGEVATAELYFDPADGWEPASPYTAISDFDTEDVRTVTSQHGLQTQHWIRTGSGPSDAKRTENARQKTAEAREKLNSAISNYEWAVRDEQRLADELRTKANQ